MILIATVKQSSSGSNLSLALLLEHQQSEGYYVSRNWSLVFVLEYQQTEGY